MWQPGVAMNAVSSISGEPFVDDHQVQSDQSNLAISVVHDESRGVKSIMDLPPLSLDVITPAS